MKERTFSFLEHTADIGILINSPDVEGIFEQAGLAFYSLVSDIQTINPSKKVEINIAGENPEELLVDFINELVYRTEVEGMLFSKFKVERKKGGIKVAAYGEKFKPEKHQIVEQVKGATYYNLEFKKTKETYQARIILDV